MPCNTLILHMQKQTISTWKTTIKTMNYHMLCIGMQTIYRDGQCLKNYLQMAVNGKIYF